MEYVAEVVAGYLKQDAAQPAGIELLMSSKPMNKHGHKTNRRQHRMRREIDARQYATAPEVGAEPIGTLKLYQ